MKQSDKFIKAFQLKYPDVTGVLVSNPDTDAVWIENWPLDEPTPTWADLELVWVEWEAGALARRKIEARTIVDKGAEACRIKIGTPIWFQDSLYQMKADESARFYLDPEPNKYKFPLLYAESEARGMTVEALCAEYAYNAAMWPRILAAIEAVRMGARVKIEAATTVAEVEAALVGVVWPV